MVKIQLFAVAGIMIVTATFVIMLLTFDRYINNLRFYWLSFISALSIWGVSSVFIGLIKTPETILTIWHIAMIGVAFIPLTFFMLSAHISKFNVPLRFKFIVFVISFIMALLHQLNSFVVLVKFSGGLYYLEAVNKFLYLFVFMFWAAIGMVSVYMLILSSLRNFSGKIQIKSIYWTLLTAMGFLGGGTNFLPAFGIEIYPYGNFVVILYPCGIAGLIDMLLKDTEWLKINKFIKGAGLNGRVN